MFPKRSIGGTTMNLLLIDILNFLSMVLSFFIVLLIAAAVMSWLIAFNVVNPRNQLVHTIWEFLYRITEPMLRPIRNRLPNLGGIDISPIILVFIIWFIQIVIIPALIRALAP